jgi:hypothetical protein
VAPVGVMYDAHAMAAKVDLTPNFLVVLQNKKICDQQVI